eukprot:256190-Chlamydomonas_euryale.AAC.11
MLRSDTRRKRGGRWWVGGAQWWRSHFQGPVIARGECICASCNGACCPLRPQGSEGQCAYAASLHIVVGFRVNPKPENLNPTTFTLKTQPTNLYP